MAEELKLKNPWLVAVWPGMGNVAISAGYYLMAKLGMHLLAEFPAHELFDVEHVEVKDGLIQPGRLPRSRFFVWNDPREQHDLVVFIGEAQPPMGKYTFCHRLIEFAKTMGVERVYTFAAMATQMNPARPSRVFVAATDVESLKRAQATGSGDNRRRPDRRSRRRAARRGGREWTARRLPAGRDAAYLRSAPIPESVAGGSRSLWHDGRPPDRFHRAGRTSQEHGTEARRVAGADAKID